MDGHPKAQAMSKTDDANFRTLLCLPRPPPPPPRALNRLLGSVLVLFWSGFRFGLLLRFSGSSLEGHDGLGVRPREHGGRREDEGGGDAVGKRPVS